MGSRDAEPYVVARETHSGVVISVGERTYKLKKPVELDAMDFRSRENRLAACRREVELNRRLAPDVYLGDAEVHGPDGAVCDHMVVMRRLPSDRSLSAIIEAGTDAEERVRDVARMVARFHADARRGAEIAEQGRAAALRERWHSVLEQLVDAPDSILADDVRAEIEHLALEFVDGRAPLLDQRIDEGRVIDGHGDLLASDVFCLDDGPRVLDCLEFNDRLRWLDGLDDAACLAMDLEHRGAGDVAHRFLDWYGEFADDSMPVALRHHYIAYRAMVRAVTSTVRHTQLPEHGRQAADMRADARQHAELAARHLRAATVRMVLVGGLPGTGKSTLSQALAERLGATMLATDQVRKELAGLDPAAPAPADYGTELYSAAHTKLTYTTLLERARKLLGHGESVVLDASWTRSVHRDTAATVAEQTHSRLVPLRCVAPSEVANQRIRNRSDTISDADEGVAEAMAAAADPWPDSYVVCTGRHDANPVAAALAILRDQ